MNTPTERLEFAPPPTRGLLRALALAVAAHLVLLAALTSGLNWKRDAPLVTAEAELWSALPQQAAPKLEVAPAPLPEPSPARQPEPAAKAPAPALADAAIAAERDKRKAEEKKRADDKALQARLNAERQLQEKAKADKARADKAKAEADKLAQDKKRQDAQKAQAAAKQQEAQRQENIRRMTGLAGATGGPAAGGTALQASGPSASYGGRLRARIKPNIVFTEDIATNPTAEVEVRTAPDGTIVGRKLLKSSGEPAWDDAVLKAIDKTEVLPRDVDGRVPPALVISFRPKD